MRILNLDEMNPTAYSQMTPEELKNARVSLGLNMKEMSQLLATPYRTYQDWELGNRRIPGICEVAVFCLLRCRSVLKGRLKKNPGTKEVYIMGRERILFKTEERRSASEIAAFLRQLADRIEQGKVTLKSGANEIDLPLPSSMSFETKVEEEDKRGKVKRKLEVEIEWVLGAENEPDDQVVIV
jgi:amphi-Trp domain-containing protein